MTYQPKGLQIEIFTNSSEQDAPENVPGNRAAKILDIVNLNSKVTIGELADMLQVDPETIKRDIDKLKKDNLLKRIGPERGGHWEIVE